MAVKDIIAGIIEREGGYVNDKNDLGGATCWGITEKVARANGYTGPMQTMPRSVAEKIYLDRYYVEPGFASIEALSPAIAEELTDTGVNMGVSVASTFLQRSLNVLNSQGVFYSDVKVDGQIGAATYAALRAYLAKRKDGEKVLLRALNCLQGARYVELCEARQQNESFLYGWLANRVSV